MTTITEEQALKILRGIVKEAGSQVEAAKRLDVSAMYLSDILRKRRSISDNLARRLPPHGYRRVIFFERIYADDIGEK